MGKIAEKAKFIDMYASLPRLSFGKDGKVYSRFGLLLTFLTIIIIGGMAIWIGINIFGRYKPAFIQYDLPPKVWNPKIPYNIDDFKFGLSLMHPDADRLVTLWPQYTDLEHFEIIPMTTRDCKFDIAPEENFLCFGQDENTKGETFLDVKGNWRVDLMYKYCSDPTKNCYSETEANDVFTEYNVMGTLFYEDLLIDPFDYENPVTTTTGFAQQSVHLAVGTIIIVELNEVEFISDNGWLFEEKEIITKFKPTITKEVTGDTLLSVRIRYGGTKTVYKRTYPKIQDFLAQVSGFITIITPIFLILISPYGNLRAIQHMTNEIYEIKLNKSNNDSGDSPQKPSAKRRRSKDSPKSATGTERSLIQQKTQQGKTLKKAPSTQTGTPFAPHAALVIGGFGKPAAKEDTPAVPDENTTPVRLKTFEKTPTSPFGTSPQKTLNEDLSPQKSDLEQLSPENPKFEHAKLLSPEDIKLGDGKLNENLEPVETPNEDVVEEEEVFEEVEEEDIPLRSSDPLEVPWQAWLKSFWKPNPEVQVLKKAQEHLSEAFDLVALSKKVNEIDKLKACLFTRDQRVVFENLPSSVIVLNPDIDLKSPEAIKQYHWKDSYKGDEVALRKAYARLRVTKNQLDQLLIRLYESEYIDDGASL